MGEPFAVDGRFCRHALKFCKGVCRRIQEICGYFSWYEKAKAAAEYCQWNKTISEAQEYVSGAGSVFNHRLDQMLPWME